MTPTGLLLDSNVWIALAEWDAALLQALRLAISEQRILVYITHLQRDELMAVSDRARREKRRDAMKLLAPVDVPTSVFILAGDDPADPSIDTLAGRPWGSRLGEAALSDDLAAERLEKYVGRRPGQGPKRLRDGVQLETAFQRHLCFITEDRKAATRSQHFYPDLQVEGLDWLRTLVMPDSA